MVKAQFSFEYLVISTFALVSVGAFVFAIYAQISRKTAEFDAVQLDRFGNSIIDTANQLSYAGGPSKLTKEAVLPSNVVDVFVAHNNYLIFAYLGGGILNDRVYHSRTNIAIDMEETSEGLKTLVIESLGNYISICSKTAAWRCNQFCEISLGESADAAPADCCKPDCSGCNTSQADGDYRFCGSDGLNHTSCHGHHGCDLSGEFCVNEDLDGYGLNSSIFCPYLGEDCDDDTSDDPAGCPETKEGCDTAEEAQCAICIHPGAFENDIPKCSDWIDNDCDGDVDCDDSDCGCLSIIDSFDSAENVSSAPNLVVNTTLGMVLLEGYNGTQTVFNDSAQINMTFLSNGSEIIGWIRLPTWANVINSSVELEGIGLPAMSPFVYSWDGSNFVFESDFFLGRDSSIKEGWSYVELKHISEPILRITNELDEIDYIDSLKLIAFTQTESFALEVVNLSPGCVLDVSEDDARYLILQKGDEVYVEFEALPAGTTRVELAANGFFVRLKPSIVKVGNNIEVNSGSNKVIFEPYIKVNHVILPLEEYTEFVNYEVVENNAEHGTKFGVKFYFLENTDEIDSIILNVVENVGNLRAEQDILHFGDSLIDFGDIRESGFELGVANEGIVIGNLNEFLINNTLWIDPTVNLTPYMDTTICRWDNCGSNPCWQTALIAMNWGSDYNKALLIWDLSSIPADSQIIIARLYFLASAWHGGTLPHPEIAAYRILEEWDCQTATNWYRMTGVGWSNMGCDAPDSRAVTEDDSVVIVNVYIWYNLNILPSTICWVSGSCSNYGVVLVNIADPTSLHMPSRESSGGKPYLFLSYKLANGHACSLNDDCISGNCAADYDGNGKFCAPVNNCVHSDIATCNPVCYGYTSGSNYCTQQGSGQTPGSYVSCTNAVWGPITSCGYTNWNQCSDEGSPNNCLKGRDVRTCLSGACNDITGEKNWSVLGIGNVCSGAGNEIVGSCTNRCGYSDWNVCSVSGCQKIRDCLACTNLNTCGVDVGNSAENCPADTACSTILGYASCNSSYTCNASWACSIASGNDNYNIGDPWNNRCQAKCDGSNNCDYASNCALAAGTPAQCFCSADIWQVCTQTTLVCWETLCTSANPNQCENSTMAPQNYSACTGTTGCTATGPTVKICGCDGLGNCVDTCDDDICQPWENVETCRADCMYWPVNVSVNFGDTGADDSYWPGELNETNSPLTISLNNSKLTNILNGCNCPGCYVAGWCVLPIRVSTDHNGTVKLDDVSIDYADYELQGVLESTNLLLGKTVGLIISFSYDCTLEPPYELWVQFSNDDDYWYDADGVLDSSTRMQDGKHLIPLTDFDWRDNYFKYRINFVSDGLYTPKLKEIEIKYL
ncbi:MAG: DNRLRE domain-containing protein [Candidatus Woesearchaeota archaeon]